MTIDAKKLKRELTIEQVIKVVESIGGGVYDNSKTECIIFYSCCHHLNASQHKPKLYYYKDSQFFTCYSCSSAFDIISLVEARWNLEERNFYFKDVLEYIAHIAGIDAGKVTRITSFNRKNPPWQDLFEKYDRKEGRKTQLKTYDKKVLDFLDHRCPQEWVDEGISIETMRYYGIGYYGFKNQTTIPCFDDQNNLVGIRVRNWRPVDNAKYDILRLLDQSEYKVSTNQILYGLNFNQYAIEKKKKVIITEAEKAVLKSHTWYGYNSIAVGTFGLSGWNLNIERRNLLVGRHIDCVIIAPDYDYETEMSKEYFEWWDKQEQLAKKFAGFCRVEIIPNINNIVPYKNNAFDMTRDIFEYLLEGRADIEQYRKVVEMNKKQFDIECDRAF